MSIGCDRSAFCPCPASLHTTGPHTTGPHTTGPHTTSLHKNGPYTNFPTTTRSQPTAQKLRRNAEGPRPMGLGPASEVPPPPISRRSVFRRLRLCSVLIRCPYPAPLWRSNARSSSYKFRQTRVPKNVHPALHFSKPVRSVEAGLLFPSSSTCGACNQKTIE